MCGESKRNANCLAEMKSRAIQDSSVWATANDAAVSSQTRGGNSDLAACGPCHLMSWKFGVRLGTAATKFGGIRPLHAPTVTCTAEYLTVFQPSGTLPGVELRVTPKTWFVRERGCDLTLAPLCARSPLALKERELPPNHNCKVQSKHFHGLQSVESSLAARNLVLKQEGFFHFSS
jgi:hypothetical protein